MAQCMPKSSLRWLIANFWSFLFRHLKMRFLQPVGVLQKDGCINVNLISSESHQITRLNENNLTNVTQTLNLQSSVNTNNFDVNKTTTSLRDILKLKPDSKYFKNYFDSQLTDASNIDLNNGNNDIILIESLNFAGDNLSKVSLRILPPYKSIRRSFICSGWTQFIFIVWEIADVTVKRGLRKPNLKLRLEQSKFLLLPPLGEMKALFTK